MCDDPRHWVNGYVGTSLLYGDVHPQESGTRNILLSTIFFLSNTDTAEWIWYRKIKHDKNGKTTGQLNPDKLHLVSTQDLGISWGINLVVVGLHRANNYHLSIRRCLRRTGRISLYCFHKIPNLIVSLHYMDNKTTYRAWQCTSGIILEVQQTNRRWRYIVTTSIIEWAHTQNRPWVLNARIDVNKWQTKRSLASIAKTRTVNSIQWQPILSRHTRSSVGGHKGNYAIAAIEPNPTSVCCSKAFIQWRESWYLYRLLI